MRDLVHAELLAVEVALHQTFVGLDHCVEQLLAVLRNRVRHLGRDLYRCGLLRPLGARIGLQVKEVDDARQLVLDADRQANGNAACRELLVELTERAVEVGALTVEHIHEDDAREAARIRALPDPSRPDLHAHDGAHEHERSVGHGQACDRVALKARRRLACR